MSRKANTQLQEFLKNPTVSNLQDITAGVPLGVNVGDPSLAKGKKIIERYGKKFIADDDMPTGFRRFTAGIQDIFQPGKDRDKRGQNIINPFADASEANVGLKELSESDLTYSPVQTKRIQKALEAEFEEPKTALEETQEYAESLKALYGDKELRKLRRDAMREETIQNQLNYMATEPIRQAFANRAAEAAAQRGLRIRAAKEAMPSNIQNIMLSKQAQAATASSAEAERARAAADQQDAATRFASLGMQRRFG